MSYIGVQYTYHHHEKFDDFLKAVGLPEEKVAAIINYKPTQKLTKDGDTYTLITSSPKGPKEIKFKSGVEFEDVIGLDNIPVKTTITLDGNVVTQIVKSSLGSANIKWEFSGDDLIVSITSEKFNGVAKRFYKA